MTPADFSQSIIEFFEGTYLPQMLEQAPPDDVKRYRNAIGQASLYLSLPVTFGELVDPSFLIGFVEHLVGKGFSAGRAKSFADCLGEIQDGAREYRQARAGQAQSAASCNQLPEELPNDDDEIADDGGEVQLVDWPPRFFLQGRASQALLSMLLPGDEVCHGGFVLQSRASRALLSMLLPGDEVCHGGL
jgi:hypothetical protein